MTDYVQLSLTFHTMSINYLIPCSCIVFDDGIFVLNEHFWLIFIFISISALIITKSANGKFTLGVNIKNIRNPKK